MTERPWERGGADATWLACPPGDGGILEYGLGFVARPRDPFDRRESGQVSWAESYTDPEDQRLAIAALELHLGKMREQLGSDDTMPRSGDWHLNVLATSLRLSNMIVTEIGLALMVRKPDPFDRREPGELTWVVCEQHLSRDDRLAHFEEWLAALRKLTP